ncbi:unnamed protein product [Brassicogethes aeneus]|uniref:Uncharacterized protein n=1 Tax=Brassicogethes aeneus TaxID=1431903 RepID=A0A9P0BE02_BRAAE|nr:unnamed protein product [Brassicogethes aeneus]
MQVYDGDIVISGVGGYFPKAENIGEFRDRLLNNENLLETRWRYGERGCTNLIGKIKTEYFDNAFFGIHRQQCTFMDPMQRLILERTFEAIIDAGVNPAEVRGRKVGCFMGSAIGENDNLFLESVVSGFGVTGHSRAMMPNRVSYWLNLKGPSIAYDSNWVGGFEVIRLAVDAIKTGQCESVVVGTANLALNSEYQWLYNDMGVLSPDGSTRAFDANGSGYARSDGIVVFFIQKATDAKRSYCSILNVDTIFNGNREGNLTDIDVDSMADFMKEFYKDLEVKPSEVEYVEAYGTGLKDFDKKEIDALEKVYCEDREGPLLVGSVKSNTGHSESTAGLFGIVKVIIAMETGIIPANIQYETPNPDISGLINGTVKVVTENQKWKGLYAAVNGIGLDSYYGHILLKSNRKIKAILPDSLPRLIVASTRTEDGIKAILETVKNKPSDPEYYSLIQNLYSNPISGHLYRGYALLGGEDVKQESEYHMGNKRQVWFVYSGMGSQWCGMASDLMQLPVFANAIHKCHKILEPKGVDLLNIITTKDTTIFDSILHSFVGIAAIQIGLTDVLHSIGIQPDGIIGHSVGELGCAYADGCMTAEQMILSAYSRGRASLEAELIKGMMAAIGMGYQQIKDKVPPTVEVACHNGPDSSTISGPTEDMEKFVKELQDQGVFARLVNVANIAYHSRYIKPAAPGLLKYLNEVLPEPMERSSKWISTSNLEENWNTDLAKHSSAEYHTNNLLSSVLFEEGLKHIPKDSVLIEIAPHGLLQAILKRSLKTGCTNVPLTQRGCKSALDFLLCSMGKLYLAGLDFQISELYPKIEFPVSKGTANLAELVHWNHSEAWRTGLEDKLQNLFGVRDIQVTLNSEEFRDCVGHQLDDKIILPCGFYLNIIYNIIASISTGQKEMVFENLHFKKVLAIPKIGSVPLHAMIQKGSGDFEILSQNDILVTGRMTFPQATDKFLAEATDIEILEDNIQLSGSDVYNEFHHRGQKYSALFKTIKSLTLSEEGSVSVIQWNSKWALFLEAMIQQQLLQAGERNQDIHVPKSIQKIAISQTLLPADKSDVKVTYNYSTGLISAEGIQIIGMRTIPYPKESKAVFYDSYEYINLSNGNYSAIENGINTALQLTLDNFEDQYITNVMITEVESSNPSLVENVKNILNQYTKLNPNVTSVKEVKQIAVQNNYPLLVVTNDYLKEDLAKLVGTAHAFALVKTDKSILSYSYVIEVAQFSVDGESYSIIKKAVHSEPTVITVKGDTLSLKDLTRGSVSWVSELNAAVATAKAKHHSVYLVSSVVPTEGFTNFKQELRSLPNMTPLRILFVLDKKPLELNVEDPFIKHIFKQDLCLSIIKDGVLSSYISIPIKYKENVVQQNITSNIIKNKTISHIGINLKDETLNPELYIPNELGNVDYSGVTSTGQRVMGLAQLDKDTCKLITDDLLTWEVPESWSLEDACTMPHAYASAYYALFIKAKLKPGETVLVHAGCSPIGLAAISIASSYGCTIYTTVSTDWQRSYVKKLYAFLKDRNVLNCENSSFEPLLLMATGGLGAHVILNCLSGSLLHSSVSCIAEYGRFIQIGKYDLHENNTIGMNIFLKNTSFYSVNLENIFNVPHEVKMELKGLIENGIDQRAVRPLVRKIVIHQNIESILSNLKKSSNVGKVLIKINNKLAMNKLNVEKPSQFICDAKSSYLVYGGNAEIWTDLTEWLILRGARKIVVSSESKPQQTHINRRLSLLQSYYGAEIVFAPSKAHTRAGAIELISEVYFLGPIHCVFLLPNKSIVSRSSDSKPVLYIDNALRTTAPKALFVNFISSAAGVCQLRSEASFGTYNIQWQKELEFNDALYSLDDILSFTVKNILIKNDKVSDTKQESTQTLFKKLSLMLPSSIDEMYEQHKLAAVEPKLVQQTTLGPREMRELSPLFIIPGLTGQKELDDLCRDLMYPTFCAVLPNSPMSIKELALNLVEKIRKVWPTGPYNLVGISWGGALALEIARLLDQNNVKIYMFFVDSAPNALQSALKHLGEDPKEMEVNLLTRVLNINDLEVIAKIRNSGDWETRVQLAFDNFEGNIPDRQTLESGLFDLKKRLQDLSAFQPIEDVVSGDIHLIRPADSSKYDNCGLTSYCKQTPEIFLVGGDHMSIIKSKETSEYINRTHMV